MAAMLLLLLICTSMLDTQAQEVGELRLAGSSKPHTGRLEIFLRGEWGTVCYKSNFFNSARVACRQLGFVTFRSASTASALLGLLPRNSSTPIWLDNVTCSSSDTTLLSCHHNDIGVHDCDHSEDVGLVCSGGYGDGALRLVGLSSNNATAGRLEIYLQGEWGTVCDDGFSSTEANVACRQLGFLHAARNGNVTELGFDPGSSSTEIWLNNVQCRFGEIDLLSCMYTIVYSVIGVENCDHSEDVALECSSNGAGVTTAGITGVIATALVLRLCCF